MRTISFIYTILFLVLVIRTQSQTFASDVQLSIPPCVFAREQGIPCEEHFPVTKDLYKLSLSRLPNPGKPMVLMLHGLHMSANCYTANFRHNTLSFMLYDQGYDVWLLSFRGSSFSTANTKLSVDSKEFWQFSWTEFGLEDIPAAVDYASRLTNVRNVTLVSHSEGGSSSYAALSSLPDLRSRVTLHVSMAPAPFVPGIKNIAFRLAKDAHLFELLNTVGVTHVSPGTVGSYLSVNACKLMKNVCDLTFGAIAGWDFSGNMNKSREHVYAGLLDTSSVHNWIHFMQDSRTSKFAYFDFGADENKKKYGQPTPPNFKLEHIDVPTALYYGGADAMVVPGDVENHLLPALTGVTDLKVVKIPEFNHADFVWGSKPFWFSEMIADINRYNRH